MFLNKSSPNYHSDDSDVPTFVHWKKNYADPCTNWGILTVTESVDGVICTHKIC